MPAHRVSRGLDIPITGLPEQKVYEAPATDRVALVADDYLGMKPRMAVAAGDTVTRGQLLFEDKKSDGIRYTAPGAGTVAAINRGDRRALQTVVIELNEAEQSGTPSDEDFAKFESFTGNDPAGLTDEQIKALLLESGLWTALRVRPFGKVAAPGDRPDAVFICAMDSNPLAADPDLSLPGNEKALEKGLLCVSKLTSGRVWLTRRTGSAIEAGAHSGVTNIDFEGPHPSGSVGYHIHTLDPVGRERKAWYLDWQDVIAIGKLFLTGRLDVTRVVSLAGPGVKTPRVIRTRLGAAIDRLTEGELKTGDWRVISGSILSGRQAVGDTGAYLGRYHLGITAIEEERDRVFLGWMDPGKNTFSITNLFLSRLWPNARLNVTTSAHGSERAIVPIGLYEKVMPFDTMPTLLLRALEAGDLERAEELGCLELVEEDLALCSFVCPSKGDYGQSLRRMLDTIEKEG